MIHLTKYIPTVCTRVYREKKNLQLTTSTPFHTSEKKQQRQFQPLQHWSVVSPAAVLQAGEEPLWEEDSLNRVRCTASSQTPLLITQCEHLEQNEMQEKQKF